MKAWQQFVAIVIAAILSATCILVNIVHQPHDDSYFRRQYESIVNCIHDLPALPEGRALSAKACLP